ncbi:MAG: FHA domain-containing protein [Anaerolineae bacterium]|nr:FHA domain-containing protein [Anaerolineae bacterium]
MNSSLVIDQQSARERGEPTTNTFYVEIVPQADRIRRVLLEPGNLIIGRSPARAQLALSDSRISRVHLRVARDRDHGVTVTDLYSANGTNLDGRQLPPGVAMHWLIDQMITIGRTRLILRYGRPHFDEQEYFL